METKIEPRKNICIDPATYTALEELAANKNMTVQEYADFLFKDATVFDSQPEPNLVSIEVPLNAEQYAKLRTWLDADEFIEVVSGPGTEKATLINSKKLWEKNHPNTEGSFGYDFLNFRVQLQKVFADFIETYLTFFNEPGSIEAFITGTVYEKVWTLHKDLTQFVKTPGHRLELQGWLEKFPERIHGNEDEQNDC